MVHMEWGLSVATVQGSCAQSKPLCDQLFGCPDKPQTEALLPLVSPSGRRGTVAHVPGHPEAIGSRQIHDVSPRLGECLEIIGRS